MKWKKYYDTESFICIIWSEKENINIIDIVQRIKHNRIQNKQRRIYMLWNDILQETTNTTSGDEDTLGSYFMKNIQQGQGYISKKMKRQTKITKKENKRWYNNNNIV